MIEKNKYGKMDEFAAIWMKRDKNNRTYLSMNVKINGITRKLVAFQNRKKTDGKNQPDFLIMNKE